MNVDQSFLEKCILYHSIKNPYFFGSIVDNVDVEYFDNTDVQCVLRHVLKYHESEGKTPSLAEIRLILTSDTAKRSFTNVLKSFKGIDTAIDIELLIKQTEKFFREQAIVRTIYDISKNFDKISHSEIAERMQEACGISLITDIGHDYFINLEEHIGWLQQDQDRISTGYDFLDDNLKGGFNANGRALYMFMGATNAGKSILLGNLAANVVKQGLCAAIVSLEMDEQMYAQRMSANFSDIPIDDLKEDSNTLRKNINQLKKDNPTANLLIKEFPTGKLTVDGLDAYITKVKKKGYPLDILFLDYITLLRVENSNGLYESGKRLAEDIRALTYKHNISIVTVLQANRSGVAEGDKPKLENTSESMGIAHTADFIATIWRDIGDEETNTIRMGIIKNRVGKNFGTISLEFNTRYLRMIESDEIFEEDKERMNQDIKAQVDLFALLNPDNK